MKKIIPLLICCVFFSATAQRKIEPTDTLKISGKVQKDLMFTSAVLDTFAKTTIGDVVITNQQGEVKGTLKNVKGILLKTLLEQMEIQVEKPKLLNEFYFLCVASDGYKVVFSWNEIFNTEIGNNLYVITEMYGKKIKDIEDRISIISTKDFKTGRRYIKGLSKIIVERVE